MPTYCSACRKSLSRGDLKCPWCGLPLTAMAMPAAPTRGQSPLFWLIVIGGLFWIFLFTLDSIQKNLLATAAQKSAAVQAPVTGYADQDRQVWISLLANPDSGKINNPYSFQQHCGWPATRVSRPTYFALMYPQENLVVMFMTRKLGTAKQELACGGDYLAFQDRADFAEINPPHMIAPGEAMKALRCTVATK